MTEKLYLGDSGGNKGSDDNPNCGNTSADSKSTYDDDLELGDLGEDWADVTHWKAWNWPESNPLHFPLSVFPGFLPDFMDGVVREREGAIDFAAAASIATLGTAMGSKWRTEYLRGAGVQKANLWGACIGPSGDGKTPTMDRPLEILKKVGVERRQEWEAYRERRWAEAMAETLADKKKVHLDPKPLTWVSDVTVESLLPRLQTNPHGLLLHRDELTALTGSFDNYTSNKEGSHRQAYLSIWSRQPAVITRNTRDDVEVDDPYLCILGGLPPEQTHRLSNKKTMGDGFMPRFLIYYPEERPPMRTRSIVTLSNSLHAEWEWLIRRLFSLDGDFLIKLHPAAMEVWCDLRDSYRAYYWSLPRELRSSCSKNNIHAARFLLMLQAMHVVTEPGFCTTENKEAFVADYFVSPYTVWNAWRLVRYFTAMNKKFYGSMDESAEKAIARKLLAGVKRLCNKTKGDKRIFSKTEIYQEMKKDKDFETMEKLYAPLAFLCDHHRLKKLSKEELPPEVKSKPGVKPEMYQVLSTEPLD